MAAKDDKHLKQDRDTIMRETRTNSLFYGLSETFKFLAATLTTVGMAIGLPSFVTAVQGTAAAAGAAAIPPMGVAAALAATPAAGLALVGAGAAFTLAAVGSHYISSRSYHAGTYDSLETNARHTAEYITKELERDGMIVSHDNPGRADGKSWAQAEEARRAQQQTVQL